MKALTGRSSPWSLFMNLRRTGKLAKSRWTVMALPRRRGACVFSRRAPLRKTQRQPRPSSLSAVSRSMSATSRIDGRASPRKPRVSRRSRSSNSASLDVLWRRKAISTSSAPKPQPSSSTRTSSLPPALSSTAISPAPASMAFSTSSLTTESGRSITSPAAILWKHVLG